MKLFIVIDLEAPKKDCVYSVHMTKEQAESSEAGLKEMTVGGKDTTIIEENVNLTYD